MEETEDKVLVTAVEIPELDVSRMADLDCSTADASMDTKVAVPSDEDSSKSESFLQNFYRSEGHKMSQNARIKKSQLNENGGDVSVATGSDLYCTRYKSVPSISPPLKEYFDMVKEEYCKKLKAKAKSRNDDQVGKSNYSSLKGVFFNKPIKRIAQKSTNETMIPSEETRHKKKGNQCSEKEKPNSNEVQLAENSKKDALSGSLSRSNEKFNRVLDSNSCENNLQRTPDENANRSVSNLVNYFENLRLSNSKRQQRKTPKSRGEKKVLEPKETEESSGIRNESIQFSQSEVKKNKNKNKKIAGKSSAKGAASSNTEVSNTKSKVDYCARCWINKNNSYPTIIFNDSISRGPSIFPKTLKNGSKRSKFTTMSSKLPLSDIQGFGRKSNVELRQSKCKREKTNKCKRRNVAETEKEGCIGKVIRGVVGTVLLMLTVVLAAAALRSSSHRSQ